MTTTALEILETAIAQLISKEYIRKKSTKVNKVGW